MPVCVAIVTLTSEAMEAAFETGLLEAPTLSNCTPLQPVNKYWAQINQMHILDKNKIDSSNICLKSYYSGPLGICH